MSNKNYARDYYDEYDNYDEGDDSYGSSDNFQPIRKTVKKMSNGNINSKRNKINYRNKDRNYSKKSRY